MKNSSVSIDINDVDSDGDEFHFCRGSEDDDDGESKKSKFLFRMDSGDDSKAKRTEFLHSFKFDLGKVPRLSSTDWSIFKVPANLRTVKPEAYDPQIVSIGPVHHGKDSLSALENQKLQYAQSLLLRTHDPLQTADVCAEGVFDLVAKVRNYYNVPLTRFKRNKLAQMMLVDGCFIVELLLRHYSIHNTDRQNDPIFTTSWMLPALRRDLALLENQIPMLISDFLLNTIKLRAQPSLPSYLTVNELALHFFSDAIHVDPEVIKTASRMNGAHLLHVIHNSYSYKLTESRVARDSAEGTEELTMTMENATTISKSGIQFKEDKSKEFLSLRFENGVFMISPLIIDDSTDSLFRNLIAFEQCCSPAAQHILSYMFLMSRLVNKAEDVELLELHGIIKNKSRGNVDVPKLFSNVCKQAVLDHFYFEGLCEQVNEYFNRRWYRHCAVVNRHFHRRWHIYCTVLRRDYFNNPWATISFIAALFLLALTALQTLYSVLSYYPR